MDDREWPIPARLQRELPFNRRRGALRKLAISANGKHVLRVLDDHADKGSCCWLRIETLSRETQLSARTVQRAVAELKGLEFITVDRRTNTTRSNRYTICWSEIWASVFGEPEPVELENGEDSEADAADAGGELRRQVGVSTGELRRQVGVSTREIETPSWRVNSELRRHIGVSHNIDEASKEEEDNKILPPPPPFGTRPAQDLRGKWLAVENAASQFGQSGMGGAAKAIAAAREHGCSPEFVAALIEFATANQGLWEKPEGALYARLVNAWPRQSISENWAQPTASQVARASAEKRLASEAAAWREKQAASAADDLRSQEVARSRQQLELNFGPELDAVLPDEAAEFIGQMLDPIDVAFQLRFWRQTGRKWPPVGMLRSMLLRRLRLKSETNQVPS